MIQSVIQNLVDYPSEKTKEEYFKFIRDTQYGFLQEANNLKPKSQEYFNKRNQAFNYEKECAMLLLTAWIKKYGNTSGCPVIYADTLNIPFRKINL